MTIQLSDDGTMDTVLRCSDCGEEWRYNYDASETEERALEVRSAYMLIMPHASNADANTHADETLYDEWIAECIEDISDNHACPPRGKRKKLGVETGCGDPACADCYEDAR